MTKAIQFSDWANIQPQGELSNLAPVSYVCLLSKQVVSLAQAVKLIRPASVIVISCDAAVQSGAEGRFVGVLASWGFPVQVVRGELENEFLDESMAMSQQWLLDRLVPVLETEKSLGRLIIANLTGAKPLAAMALEHCWDWHECHYAPAGASGQMEVLGKGVFGLPALDFNEEIRFVSKNVGVLSDVWTGIDSFSLRKASEGLHSDWVRGQDGGVLFQHWNLLQAIWCGVERLDRPSLLLQYGVKDAGKSVILPAGPLADLLGQTTLTDPDVVRNGDGGLTIPASRSHRWVDFVCGGWWSCLVAAWIADSGRQGAANVSITLADPGGDNGQRTLFVRCPESKMQILPCATWRIEQEGTADIIGVLNGAYFSRDAGIDGIAISPSLLSHLPEVFFHYLRDFYASLNVAIIETQDDVVRWLASCGTQAKLPVYAPQFSPGRAADDIVAEAERLLGSWQPDKKQCFKDLEEEFLRSYPGKKLQFDQLKERDKSAHDLLEKAYKRGAGSEKVGTYAELVAEAKRLNIPGIDQKMDVAYDSGDRAKKRAFHDQKNKANGRALSTVQPRPNKAQKTILPESMGAGRKVVPTPPELHPNDIRALQPASAWTLLMDEAGDNFSGTGTGKMGRFVGLMVRSESPGLVALPSGWHAVDRVDPADVDKVVQGVLDAPCGVIGLPLSGLPITPNERWLDGMLAIIDWVVRLLPLDGPTRINVQIEARPPFPPRTSVDVAARDAMARLARIWPERASKIRLDIQLIGKADHGLNGYVDALAFTWGSPAQSAKDRCKRTQFPGTCFLNADAHDMKAFWDAWDRVGGVQPFEWARWVALPDAQSKFSIVSSLLTALADECRQDTSRIAPYLQETRRHLASKAINLKALAAQIGWLKKVMPDASGLPPRMRLVWLTAQLTQANHHGKIDQAEFGELRELVESLFDEDAPLVCQATLGLAVNATNYFNFELAEQLIIRWNNVEKALPGLRYWGQVQSFIGQCKAFAGDNESAAKRFDVALESFSRLSEPADVARESSQTLCYRFIAEMDNAASTNNDVRGCWAAYRQPLALPDKLEDAVAILAASSEDRLKYAHHILLRWAVFGREAAIWTVYGGMRGQWTYGEGHPWPLIELYRGILLRTDDANAALEQAMAAASLAFSADQGPTVQLIGAVCRAVAVSYGAPWEESAAMLASLNNQLPLARSRIDRLAEWIRNPQDDPRGMIAEVLPFNFR